MTVSYLPMLTSIRGDLHTALNKIDAYESLCAQREWTGKDVSAAQTRAVQTIRARVLAAANRLDLIPQDRERLERTVRTLRDENEGLRATVARQRAKLEQLNAAVERQGVECE